MADAHLCDFRCAHTLAYEATETADHFRGHTNPDELPAWIFDELPPNVWGYCAAAYLAGVQVGRLAPAPADVAAAAPANTTPENHPPPVGRFPVTE